MTQTIPKTILITGATDGIGLETAKLLAAEDCRLLLHGRSDARLAAAKEAVGGAAEPFQADLSRIDQVEALAAAVARACPRLDVLINNAGVFRTNDPITPEGLDVRFVVNTLAPYLLTQRLLPLMGAEGRIVNLSSAAQAPVDIAALKGKTRLDHMPAYAQSKLAITLWSRVMAEALPNGPLVVAVNPGSLLASKMVKEGFGVEGSDLGIGADILRRAALSEEFNGRSGQYFDNDAGRFAPPNPAALDPRHAAEVMAAIEETLKALSS